MEIEEFLDLLVEAHDILIRIEELPPLTEEEFKENIKRLREIIDNIEEGYFTLPQPES